MMIEPSHTYHLRWIHFAYLALPVALALAPGVGLLPALQNGDYGSDRLGVYIFLVVAVIALADLAGWLVLAALSVRLVVWPGGVVFYGIGYAIRSTWANVAQVRSDPDGTWSHLVLRQSELDELGLLGALSVIIPLLSLLAPRPHRPFRAPQVNGGLISLKPFTNDQLQADIRRYAPAEATASSAATPSSADGSVSTDSSAGTASAAAGAAVTPPPAKPQAQWRLAVLIAGLAAALLAEAALGQSMVQRWLGVPAWRTFNVGAWVNGVAFSPGDQGLVAVTDTSIQAWRLSDGVGQTLPLTMSVRSMALSPDGRMLATGSANGTVALWPMAGGSARRVWPAHKDQVNSVAFAPDGQTLATGSKDGLVRLWRVADGQLLYTLRAEAADTKPETIRAVSMIAYGRP